MTALQEVARTVDWQATTGAAGCARLSDAVDVRTATLIDGFVHENGPPPGRFQWLALGSHARRELHCASDQDHALVWDTATAASGGYAADLAAAVIGGLSDFGLRRCDGGYMADRWSLSAQEWGELLRDRVEEPTPQAVVDSEVFLDMRPLRGTLDIAELRATLATGGSSPRLLHGLARAALGFGVPAQPFGRLPRGEVDVKRVGLAPIVLLARLYGLRCGSPSVGTLDRLRDAVDRGELTAELGDDLARAFDFLTVLRIKRQLLGEPSQLSDRVPVAELSRDERAALRDSLRAVRAAQSATALVFRTDL